MKRRDFVKMLGLSGAAAAVAATSFAGCNAIAPGTADVPDDPAALDPNDLAVAGMPAAITFENKADVLVVGSGIAGLSAAYPLAKAGKSVIVAEKLNLLGGQAVNSNGVLHVAGTDVQKQAGVSDDVDSAWERRQTHLKALGLTDFDRAKTLFYSATEWANLLVNECGATFESPKDYADEGLNEGILLPKLGIGDMKSVMMPLRDTLMDLGVTFLTDYRAVAFISAGRDGICGMRFSVDKLSGVADVYAKAVVVATGGFSSSQELIHETAPGWEQAGCYTFSATGDGQRFCSMAGAALAGMDGAVFLTSDIPWAAEWGRFAPTLIVDPQGNRFAREDEVTEAAATCFKNVLGYWWTVFDGQLAQSSQGRSVAEVTSKNKTRLIGPFDTKAELAKAMGLAENALDQAFEDYDTIVEKKADTAFGRTAQLKALVPPYYALKQRPVRFLTLGGPNIDDDGRVLGATGLAIPHMYCCGAVANGGGEGLASSGACGLMVGRAVLDDLNQAEAEAQAKEESATK